MKYKYMYSFAVSKIDGRIHKTYNMSDSDTIDLESSPECLAHKDCIWIRVGITKEEVMELLK